MNSSRFTTNILNAALRFLAPPAFLPAATAPFSGPPALGPSTSEPTRKLESHRPEPAMQRDADLTHDRSLPVKIDHASASCRQLTYDGESYGHLNHPAPYPDGARILNGSKVVASSNGALGTGAVLVAGAAVSGSLSSLLVTGPATRIANPVDCGEYEYPAEAMTPSDRAVRGGMVVVVNGAELCGSLKLGAAGAETGQTSLLLIGGRFSGELFAHDACTLEVGPRGVFSGRLQMAPRARLHLTLHGTRARLCAPLRLGRGARLNLEGEADDEVASAGNGEGDSAGSGGLFAELILEMGAQVAFGAHATHIGGASGRVRLRGAGFDVAGTFDAPRGKTGTGRQERRLFVVEPGRTDFADRIRGRFRACNPIPGHEVRFERRLGGRELWAVLRPIARSRSFVNALLRLRDR